MSTKLPVDENGEPIPVLPLLDSLAHKITSTGTAAKNTNAFDSKTRAITVYPTVDCFVRQSKDGTAATTSDHFLPGGQVRDLGVGGGPMPHRPYISVVPVSGTVDLYVSERG